MSTTHEHARKKSGRSALFVALSYLLIGLLCLSTAATANAAEQSQANSSKESDKQPTQNTPTKPYLKITVDVVNGTGDDPMIVVWAESRKGFTKTLYWFSKDEEWYKDLTTWDKKRSSAGYKRWQDEPGVDAVMGPTIPWGGSKTCTIPIQQGKINLLDGSYRLRIEQCKDKGGHYKKFKLPLTKNFTGGVLDKKNGYISKLKIEVVK